MIKILYINHVTRMSGAEVSLINLLKILDRSQYLPIVVCPPGGRLPKELEQLQIQTEFLDFRRLKRSDSKLTWISFFFHYSGILWKLTRLIKKYKIQLVHSNSTNAFIYGAVAAKLRRIPSVWTVRDLVPLGTFGRILYSLSGKVIVPSRAVGEEVKKFGHKNDMDDSTPYESEEGIIENNSRRSQRRKNGKMVKIFNGIDLEEWSAINIAGGVQGKGAGEESGVREQYGIKHDAPLAAVVGQLIPWKGHRDFLKAVSIIANEIPDIRALIVGEDLFDDFPGYKEELQNFCGELGIHHNVIFTGYRDDIQRVLIEVDLLVLPSENEPFGRVILEAMALEKPVIATNAGGPPEIIENGKTGILVPPQEPVKLAEAMAFLVNNPGRREEMGRAGRLRVEERFSIQSVARETETVYKELLGAVLYQKQEK